MQRIIQILKSVFVEVVLVFLYILLINNYLGNANRTLNADGVGYYEYLPSLFIHHDMYRKDVTSATDTSLYHRISSYAFYVDYEDFKVNKYPCGTAVLESPFFLFTHMIVPNEGNYEDGYQRPYQLAVFYAALFYLFLTLVFMAGLLKMYGIRRPIIIATQFLMVFSTGVLHYANDEAGFSHIYSLFAITAFSYYTKAYFSTKLRKQFFLASVFLGLIVILRQVNIIVLLIVPFLAGSFSELKMGLKVFKDFKAVLQSLLIFFGIFSIQAGLWYAQTGHFLVYSYQGEGFNFLSPEIFNVLFSYRKGLFIYSPILFISLYGLVVLIIKKQYYLVITWALFFTVLTYILASWHSWFYGCSYGQRPYIDFYALFFLLLAFLLNETHNILRFTILILSFVTIPINIIQTYQYKSFILEWTWMDKKKYWDVFLKTSDKFKGYVWKKTFYMPYLDELARYDLGDILINENSPKLIFELNTDTLSEINKLEIIQVKLKNVFNEDADSRMIVNLVNNESNATYYWHAVPFIHLNEGTFGDYNEGMYNFQFKPITGDLSMTIKITFEPVGLKTKLDDVKVLLLRKK